jgi:hypothetical protein
MSGANIHCVKSNTFELGTPRRKQEGNANTNEKKITGELFKSEPTFIYIF